MAIPLYRHNFDHDDWEVASVYDSDGCESQGCSEYDDGSMQCTGSLDDPVLRLHSILQDDVRPRVAYHQLPQPQHHQKFASAPVSIPQRDTRFAPGKLGSITSLSSSVVPPPGVIFPTQDWVYPSRDAYIQPMNGQMAPDPNVGLIERPPSFSLAPPPPPSRSPSPLMRRPSPTPIMSHGQTAHPGRPPHSTSGTGNQRVSPIIPPPLYHELPPPPRLADTGCQAPPGMVMSPLPRRPTHEILPSYAGPTQLPRRQSSEDVVKDGPLSTVTAPLSVGSGALSSHLSYGSGVRGEPLQVSSLAPVRVGRENDRATQAGRMARVSRPQTRERRPSIWQRFVRRFSPSRGSVGQSGCRKTSSGISEMEVGGTVF